jgi:4-amino-4-deoxy-L-arabinose transferase-like glycosyltransferase
MPGRRARRCAVEWGVAPPAVRQLEPASFPRSSARRLLVPLCLIVVLVRATYVLRPLRNDEGGYLLAARQWRGGGEFMYGDYFVDRPPLLMLLFKVASLTEWDQAIRVLAIPFVLLFVLAGWRAGTLLGGPAGGRWAAVVAAGIMCSPAMAAEQADGELFGAALVMAALALALSAWNADSATRRFGWAVAAGAVAAAAPLIKQSLLEGLLLLTGLVVLGHWSQGAARRRALLVGGGSLLGALLVCSLFVVWLAAAHIAPADAWHDLVGSRGVAFDTLWSTSPDDNIRRAGQLLVLGSITGLLPVVVTWLLAARRGPGRGTVEVKLITPLLVFGVVGIASGGAYWPAYLLQLAPAAVLAAGAMAPSISAPGAWMRGFSRVIVVAAVVGTLVSGVVYATVPSAWSSQRTGEWLADSKAASDTGFVAYGLPSVLEAADVPSPYPHLWSAAMRSEDPEQLRLRATLAGPTAPTWIVQVNGLNAWGIDDRSRLRDLIRQRYRIVAEICGHRVWLRQDVTRDLAAPPRC